MNPVRVAVVGAGGIGGAVATHLCHAEATLSGAVEVTLYTRAPLEGLRVETPAGTLQASPPVVTRPAAVSRPADWLFLAVKTYDTVAALTQWASVLLGPRTRVLVLQNGVEPVESVSRWVHPALVVPSVQVLPVERQAPGRLLQRRPAELLVGAGADAEALVALFRGSALTVTPTVDLRTALWQKLAANCAGGVSAVRREPARVVHAPGAADEMRALVAECIAVARAEGVALDADLPERAVEGARAADPEATNSLLADRLAGRPLEIDARHGVVVRRGRLHGIATPANLAVCRALGWADPDAGEGRPPPGA